MKHEENKTLRGKGDDSMNNKEKKTLGGVASMMKRVGKVVMCCVLMVGLVGCSSGQTSAISVVDDQGYTEVRRTYTDLRDARKDATLVYLHSDVGEVKVKMACFKCEKDFEETYTEPGVVIDKCDCEKDPQYFVVEIQKASDYKETKTKITYKTE